MPWVRQRINHTTTRWLAPHRRLQGAWHLDILSNLVESFYMACFLTKMTNGMRMAFICGIAAALTSQAFSVTLMPPDAWPNSQWSEMVFANPLITSTEMHGENWLQIARTADNSGSGQVVYNAGFTNVDGNPVANPANQLSDFSGSVILGISTQGDSHGVILRSGGSGFNSSTSYYVAISASQLRLHYGLGDAFSSTTPTKGVVLAATDHSKPLLNLRANANNQYKLEFSAIGMTFSAALWQLDTNGNVVGEDPISAFSYVDTRPEARSEGYFGLRGGRYGGSRTTSFRDLQIEIIPEPSTLGLLLPASLLAFVKRKRKGY